MGISLEWPALSKLFAYYYIMLHSAYYLLMLIIILPYFCLIFDRQGGFYSYYIQQGKKSDKERKFVRKKLSFMHTKGFNRCVQFIIHILGAIPCRCNSTSTVRRKGRGKIFNAKSILLNRVLILTKKESMRFFTLINR